MIKKTLIFFFIVGPFLGLMFAGIHIGILFKQKYSGPDISFTVQNGDTFGKINQRLYNQGLISNTRLFHYYAKYLGTMTKFKAGDFTIKSGSQMPDIMQTLIYGQPNLLSVTIPEGKNIFEIAKIINESGIASETDFLNAARDPELISQVAPGSPSLEGYLFPDTYKFSNKTPSRIIIKSMIDLFNKKTTHLDFTHPFLSKHEVIILSSVVEKETGAKFERPAIAGVFTNRLIKKMRLESDPTTIYGIWSRYNGNIKKSDLLEKTPYNTYKIPALPVGPISNPSLEAIEAVLNPEKHDYLFFVSKNDGTHIFTRNYKEHLEAVESFQKDSRARQGKSWRDLRQQN
jgi:UPF0755 protein